MMHKYVFILIVAIFTAISMGACSKGSSGSSSKYGVIKNDDGTIKYYDKNSWKESSDGNYIYDKYGNVKEK